jgi:hypothetical protein
MDIKEKCMCKLKIMKLKVKARDSQACKIGTKFKIDYNKKDMVIKSKGI